MYKEALEKFAELSQVLSEEELDKFAKDVIENSGDTSIIYDITAGADPTNVLSYNAAKINKGNHLKHRVIQDTSSFGIATVGDTAITAAGALAAAGAMKIPAVTKRFPQIAETLSKKENAEFELNISTLSPAKTIDIRAKKLLKSQLLSEMDKQKSIVYNNFLEYKNKKN